ncbi:MAG: hypothetical protein GY761_01045 [Hyphomicrobiales bacterium]|nr:hypothetical protein [Hyphomicrobiales bacterium]
MKTIQIESQPTIASYKEAFPTSRVAGKTVIIVRTNTGYQKEQQEVAGAKCTMESEEIYASFVSPAKITVPTFSQRSKFANRGRPSPLRVECHIDGKFGVNSLTANDKEVSVATNAGIAGAVVSLLVSGAIASATPWRYAQLNYVHIDNVAQLDGETKLDGEAKAE